MTWMPPREALGGLPLQTAQLYGMPHLGAFYRGGGVDSHKAEDGASCALCGRPASNVHHCPPKSNGRVFAMRTPMGTFVLKPALFALCGSGAAGCHGRIHSKRYTVRWEWDDDGAAEAWWSGELLSHGFAPHDARLWELGRYIATDEFGREMVLRGKV